MGGWKDARSGGAWASPRSYFDGAQHERPHTGDDPHSLQGLGTGSSPLTPEAHFQPVKGVGTGHRPTPPGRGTLTPLVPLALRAFKGEGERRTEGRTYAVHACGPLVQYWGGRGKGHHPRFLAGHRNDIGSRRGGVGKERRGGMVERGPPPRSYFDGALHERPHTGEGTRKGHCYGRGDWMAGVGRAPFDPSSALPPEAGERKPSSGVVTRGMSLGIRNQMTYQGRMLLMMPENQYN